MMNEVTASCDAHGDLVTEQTDDPSVGLIAGVVGAHTDANPSCAISYRSEPADEAEARRRAERDADTTVAKEMFMRWLKELGSRRTAHEAYPAERNAAGNA